MKIEVSDYFKGDYRAAYLFKNNKNRNVVELVHKNSTKENPIKRFISYAKYLWISYNKQEVPEGYEVDHINEDGTDDRIENLQLLTKRENIQKARNLHPKQVSILVCPVCNKEFTTDTRFVGRYSQPTCCCRRCSGLYSHGLRNIDVKRYYSDKEYHNNMRKLYGLIPNYRFKPKDI